LGVGNTPCQTVDEPTAPDLAELSRRVSVAINEGDFGTLVDALPGASAFPWADGKIARVNNYRDSDAAWAAAEVLAKERA